MTLHVLNQQWAAQRLDRSNSASNKIAAGAAISRWVKKIAAGGASAGGRCGSGVIPCLSNGGADMSNGAVYMSNAAAYMSNAVVYMSNAAADMSNGAADMSARGAYMSSAAAYL